MNKAASSVLAALAITIVSGCTFLRPTPDNSRYFLLSSTDTTSAKPDEGTATSPRPDIRLGIGPIKLPGYLDNQRLIRTGPAGSVEYVRGAYWAESLSEGFARALLHRTSARIGTANAVAYPWYATAKVDWKVAVDVLRFEATTDGRAVLVAHWTVEHVSDGRVAGGAQSAFEETAGSDPALVVDGLSRCVNRLADAIAAAVTAAASAPPVRPGDSGRPHR